MQAVTAEHPDIVSSSPDFNLRRGIGYGDEESRRIVTFAQYEQAMALQDGSGRRQVRRWGLVMRPPVINKRGQVETYGGGEPVVMPAEKFLKWFGQGYRPCKGPDDHDLYEFPAPPPPARWTGSMVEDAIAEGRAIPEDMAPAGYMGPVFKTQRQVVDEGTVTAGVAQAVASAGPTLYSCEATDCSRFFDSAQGLAVHKRNEHKVETVTE